MNAQLREFDNNMTIAFRRYERSKYTRNDRHLKTPKIRDKCMAVGLGSTDYHTFCLLFSGFSNVCHSAAVWPTALKLGCITNFDMLFLVMGFISLVDKIQFMLISSRHICISSIPVETFCIPGEC